MRFTINTVIFDVDGVLINSFDANLKFNQDLMVVAGYAPITKEEYLDMFHLSMEKLIKVVTKSNDENEIKRVFELGKNVVEYRHDLLTTPYNYRRIVKKLSKKYRLAIVTSRIKESVFSLPQLSSLEDLFEVTVCYEDTKKHKPDPEPLLFACKKLKIKPEEAVYIGDTQSDILSAGSASMKVISYNKKILTGADAQTSVFTDLPHIIESLI